MKRVFHIKTKEELNALKERIETLSKELRALSDEELEYVTGGVGVTNEESYTDKFACHLNSTDTLDPRIIIE